MPTYVYECDEGHEVEVQQRITEDPLTECPKRVPLGANTSLLAAACRQPCRRIIQPAAFVLRGNDWGRDGYSSNG